MHFAHAPRQRLHPAIAYAQWERTVTAATTCSIQSITCASSLCHVRAALVIGHERDMRALISADSRVVAAIERLSRVMRYLAIGPDCVMGLLASSVTCFLKAAHHDMQKWRRIESERRDETTNPARVDCCAFILPIFIRRPGCETRRCLRQAVYSSCRQPGLYRCRCEACSRGRWACLLSTFLEEKEAIRGSRQLRFHERRQDSLQGILAAPLAKRPNCGSFPQLQTPGN